MLAKTNGSLSNCNDKFEAFISLLNLAIADFHIQVSGNSVLICPAGAAAIPPIPPSADIPFEAANALDSALKLFALTYEKKRHLYR